MEKNLFFESSDGWLFATLLCLKNKVLLKDIISIGNMLNHAIFSLEQINNGLSRLESEDFIEIEKPYIYKKDKAKMFVKKNKVRFESCINEQVRYSNIFSKMSLNHEVIYKKYFTIEEYEIATKIY